jgi:hypothetical protein
MRSLFLRGEAYSSGVSEKQKKQKALRSLRLCLPYEIHVNEERSEFHWGGE